MSRRSDFLSRFSIVSSSDSPGADFSFSYPAAPPPIFVPGNEFDFRRCVVEYVADGRDFRHDFVLDDGLECKHLEAWCELIDGGRTVKFVARAPLVLRKLRFWAVVRFPEGTRMTVNGFQGWTMTQELDLREKIRPLRRFLRSISLPYGDYAWVDAGGLVAHQKTMFRLPDGSAFSAAFESDAYGYFQWDDAQRILSAAADVEGRVVEPGETMRFRWFWRFYEPRRDFSRPLTGFTTWYNFYNRIDENLILRLIDEYSGFPIDVFQIDDGWQRAIGDWRENDKFKGGMGRLARAIKDAGFKAGLWLAPFVCQQGSEAFGRLKRKIVAGFNPMWAGGSKPYFYRYDPDDDELRRIFDRVIDEWGFDFLKLDFLYAPGVGEEKITRGERLLAALEQIGRAVDKRASVLACGIPCRGVGKPFDYWRMGPDVGPVADLKIGKFLGNRERISTLNALRNVIVRTRLWLAPGVGHDPDVFLLRDYKTRLPHELRFSNYWINVVCGDLLFTSDEPSRYGPDLSRLYKMHFPHRPLTSYDYRLVEDDVYALSFEKNGMRYAAFVNLTAARKRVKLGDEAQAWIRWENRAYFPAPHPLSAGYDAGGRFSGGLPKPFNRGDVVELAPYATRVFVVFDTDRRCLAGGDGHILPGCEFEPDGTRHPHALKEAKTVFHLPKERASGDVPYGRTPDFVVEG